MKHFYKGALLLAAFALSLSCRKDSSHSKDSNRPLSKSRYRNFIDSLDNLSQEQRLAAIKQESSHSINDLINNPVPRPSGITTLDAASLSFLWYKT